LAFWPKRALWIDPGHGAAAHDAWKASRQLVTHYSCAPAVRSCTVT
jgi:hypothetical protein